MKQNMVYGVFGIKVRNSMWNASLDGEAKQDSYENIYSSSQSFGYADKEQLERDGYNVLYRKVTGEKGDLTLKEAFELKTSTNTRDNKKLTANEMKALLFKFEDVIRYGTTFTAYDGILSFGICGAIQIGIGVNKYTDTQHIINDMMTCFKADKKEVKEGEESTKSSLGSQVLLDKAHIVYDFTINPFEYEKYTKVIKNFEGFTEEHYKNFKKTSLKCVSNLNSKSKKGCTNEFGMFVESKDEIRDNIDLNCLGEYIKVDIVDDVVIYDLSLVADLLNEVKEDLKSVEIYYDHRIMKLVGKIEGAKYFNIKTRRELEI
ncbi:MAG: type I CRISPR-associated protein Cas7 [Sarcina sp.]